MDTNVNHQKYITTWGNAISIADRRPENYAKDLTLRYPIRPMFDGTKLKITLDNFCGTEAVRVTRVLWQRQRKMGDVQL